MARWHTRATPLDSGKVAIEIEDVDETAFFNLDLSPEEALTFALRLQNAAARTKGEEPDETH